MWGCCIWAKDGAGDVWRLKALRWDAQTSMLKTLAAKHKSSVKKMAARQLCGQPLRWAWRPLAHQRSEVLVHLGELHERAGAALIHAGEMGCDVVDEPVRNVGFSPRDELVPDRCGVGRGSGAQRPGLAVPPEGRVSVAAGTLEALRLQHIVVELVDACGSPKAE